MPCAAWALWGMSQSGFLPTRRRLFKLWAKAHTRQQLDQIESDISSMKFPLDFTDRVYTLRQHVNYVRAHLPETRKAV